MTHLLRCILVAAASVTLFAPPTGAAIPSPGNSTVTPILVGTTIGLTLPGGNNFTVVVRDPEGAPLPGMTVTIDFSSASGSSGLASGVAAYEEQVDGAWCTGNRISMLTDDTGTAVFRPIFGGAENSQTISVRANEVLIALVKARSVDMFTGGASYGRVDLADVSVFATDLFTNPYNAEEADFFFELLEPDGRVVGLLDLAILHAILFDPENASGLRTPCR